VYAQSVLRAYIEHDDRLSRLQAGVEFFRGHTQSVLCSHVGASFKSWPVRLLLDVHFRQAVIHEG
jgi:hypothetical protein